MRNLLLILSILFSANCINAQSVDVEFRADKNPNVGETWLVEIVLITGNQAVSQAGVSIDFNPSIVSVIDIVDGDFTFALGTSIDNNNGEIDYSGFAFSNIVQEEILLGTIRFEILEMIQSSDLQFVSASDGRPGFDVRTSTNPTFQLAGNSTDLTYFVLTQCFNSAGDAVTAEGEFFQADGQFSGGSTIQSINNIAGTQDDILYQSSRKGNFSYSVPLMPGSYRVTLFFAEIEDVNQGDRTFGITINGDLVDENFEILSNVGSNTALTRTYQANVNSMLNIELSGAQSNLPILSGFCATFLSEVLPVRLLSFSATPKENNQVSLEWIVASEINFDHYLLERSRNGETWDIIQTIFPNLEGQDLLEYSHTDQLTIDPTDPLYYRLKMIDLDGSYSYSEIESVHFNNLNNSTLKFYPNPANDLIKINDLGQAEFYEIISLSGKTIASSEINHGQIRLNNIPSGIYIIYIKNEFNQVILNEKLVVNQN